MSTRLEVRYTLESAHRLWMYTGKCSRLHGHNYRVTLVLERDELDHGFVMDSAGVDACVRPIFAKLDHRTILEEADPLVGLLQQDNVEHVFVLPTGRPTAENIARWLYERMHGFMSHEGRQRLVRVRVEENDEIAAEHPA